MISMQQPHPYPRLANEQNRLNVLAEYNLVDTPPEEDFDRLAGLAARLFDVPIVLVSLVERNRQFFKANVGLDVCETSREVSFCAHAMVSEDILFIPDASKDPRFSSNSLVLGPPFIRFYAGKPLVTPTGEKLGTVCLIDSKPRPAFTAEDRKNLTDLAALVMNRMEIHRLEYVRSINQARFENIAATSPDAIICSNSEGNITFWNQSAERLFGHAAEDVIDHPSEIIVPTKWRDIYQAELRRMRKGERLEIVGKTIELSGLRKNGTEFPAEFSLSIWQEGDTASIGAIVRDTTEHHRSEERLLRLASVDSLTDLPNRAACRTRLDEATAIKEPVSILLLDLDEFKEINDTLGHSAGDSVLKEVAARLRSLCTMAAMVARLGGDEFVVLLSGDDLHNPRAIAGQIINTLSQPFEVAGRSCNIGVSIGISIAPQHGDGPEELLNAADLALYRAKSAGKEKYEIFEPQMRELAVAKREFQRELRQAFENGEFELFYQPQFSIADRRLTGAEALLRWNHPERGLLTPASFIDVLSQKPTAGAMGDWILKTACRQAAGWRQSIPDFRIGINLFEAQFRSGRLLESVREAMEENNLPAEAIELEIVENVMLHNDAKTLSLLQDLRTMGVGLAFDDYGTGFASLSLLKRYPVTRLKIDRSFVQDATTDTEDAAVVKTVLYLARSFGMEVIAEGVEQEAQLDFLREHQCQEAQGYLFSEPLPAHEFETRFCPQRS